VALVENLQHAYDGMAPTDKFMRSPIVIADENGEDVDVDHGKCNIQHFFVECGDEKSNAQRILNVFVGVIRCFFGASNRARVRLVIVSDVFLAEDRVIKDALRELHSQCGYSVFVLCNDDVCDDDNGYDTLHAFNQGRVNILLCSHSGCHCIRDIELRSTPLLLYFDREWNRTPYPYKDALAFVAEGGSAVAVCDATDAEFYRDTFNASSLDL
jgi:hypothetical protein